MPNDIDYQVYQHYGTNAERLAFTPSPAAIVQPIYIWFETDTLTTWLYYTTWIQLTGAGAIVVDPYGALDGDGTSGSPLAVRVDNVTIEIDGANNLAVIPGAGNAIAVDPYGALFGDGSIAYPLGVNVDNVSIIINGANQLEAVGTSGNITSTTAVGSEPGSPATGDLDFYTNGFGISRYSGSAWPLWGPAFAFTAPVDGDFAWINQGGASVSTTNGGIFLRAPAGASDSLRIRKKAAPATPYKIIAAFLVCLIGKASEVPYGGLCFRQSSDGKLATLNVMCHPTQFLGTQVALYKFSDATTFSAEYDHLIFSAGVGIVWLRLQDNGVSRLCDVSGDGQNWFNIHTVGRTDFLTANEVGWFVTGTTTYEAGMTLLSWQQTS